MRGRAGLFIGGALAGFFLALALIGVGNLAARFQHAGGAFEDRRSGKAIGDDGVEFRRRFGLLAFAP